MESTAAPNPGERAGVANHGAHTAIAGDLYCPRCGYNLRGLTSDRCPECGLALDVVKARQSSIPWTYRHRDGLIRTYWRTVMLITFRGRTFFQEVERPVDLADAQAFRWATILHVFVPVVAIAVGVYLLAPAPVFGVAVVDDLYAAYWPAGVLMTSFLLFLLAATGISGYFFHPRNVPVARQDRAIALAYYAYAPLAWTPLVFLVGGAALATERLLGRQPSATLVLVGVGGLAIWVAVWNALLWLARRAMPDHNLRGLLLTYGLPVLWLALGALILFGLPLVVLYVVLVFASLR